jgi:ATP-dependent DNA helicase RecG
VYIKFRLVAVINGPTGHGKESLPDTISVEELGTGRSEIRNRILAPIFKDLKIIEAWGTGIQKIKQALKYYSEIELVLQEVGHAFQIQFRKKTDQIGTKSAPSRH